MRSAIVIIVLWAAGTAAASPVLLPSPTNALDSQVPLRAATPAVPVQLPQPARVANSQSVLVDVADSGAVMRVRVRQRLMLTGLGDFFFQIPAPLRDVRALPRSQSEPGLRRNAILWQGFVRGRRILAAEIELEPRAAIRALPLRVERSAAGITIRNATSTEAPGFVAQVRRSLMLRVLARIVGQAAQGRLADAPAIDVEGPTTGRRLRVDAPLRIRARVEQGGSVRRIRLVLGGPRPSQTTIEAPPGTILTLVAEPTPLLTDLARPAENATAEELLLLAERALFRLARVNQYRSFLASPAPGRAHTVYRFQTVSRPAPPQTERENDRGGVMLVLALGVGGVLALGGAVVAWAHL